MNEKFFQLAKRIFDFACQKALESKAYIRYVNEWREKSNYLIYDIVNIIKNAYLDGQTHEFMNMLFWRSLGEPAVYVKFQGSKQFWKITLAEEVKFVESI